MTFSKTEQGELLGFIMVCGKGDVLQTTYLNDLRKQHISVVVYLVSGVSHAGKIDSFDQHTILLRHGDSVQLIYKYTIASIKTAPKTLSASTSMRTK